MRSSLRQQAVADVAAQLREERQQAVADLAAQLREEGPQFADGRTRTKALYVAVLKRYFDDRTLERARRKSDVVHMLRVHMLADIAKLPPRCGCGHAHEHMCAHGRCRMCMCACT